MARLKTAILISGSVDLVALAAVGFGRLATVGFLRLATLALAQAFDPDTHVASLYASHDEALATLRSFAQAPGGAKLHLDIQFCGSVDAIRALNRGAAAIVEISAAALFRSGVKQDGEKQKQAKIWHSREETPCPVRSFLADNLLLLLR